MKRIGILGGIGPESTVQYYRFLIQQFKERQSTEDYPEIILHSINMTEMLSYVFSEDLDGLVSFLQKRVQLLEKSGVDYVAMASNTPHLVFDQLANSVQVPMISIVEETCKRISKASIKKLGLLGTKSTMSKGFYQKTGKRHGLEIIIPAEEAQDYVNEKYFGELVFNQIFPETKNRLIQIARELENKYGIQGLILGGTELPLILKHEDFKQIKVFDTTQIHVNAILDRMLE